MPTTKAARHLWIKRDSLWDENILHSASNILKIDKCNEKNVAQHSSLSRKENLLTKHDKVNSNCKYVKKWLENHPLFLYRS